MQIYKIFFLAYHLFEFVEILLFEWIFFFWMNHDGAL